MWCHRLAGAAIVAAALATAASAQLIEHKDLSLAIATTAVDTCKADGVCAKANLETVADQLK